MLLKKYYACKPHFCENIDTYLIEDGVNCLNNGWQHLDLWQNVMGNGIVSLKWIKLRIILRL